jgi:hypothetical protein
MSHMLTGGCTKLGIFKEVCDIMKNEENKQ